MKKYIKIFLIEFIIVLMVFIYIFNNKKNENVLLNYNSNSKIDKIEHEEELDSKDLYSRLENGLLEGEEDIKMNLSSLFTEPNKVFSILEKISYENPEVMYYKGAEYSFGKVKLVYSNSTKDIKEHQDEIKDIRQIFFENNIKANMTDYEKILSIHDYIVDKAAYDTRLFSEGEVPPESYSTYGILALGVGVCESYAKSMKYLLDEAEIESMIVIGSSKGENHAWNLVNIEGEYYHIDPTWNDPVMEDGSHIIRYNFFNLSDDEISKSHDWDRSQYPEARGTKYNYYKYNKLTALGSEDLKGKLKRVLLKRMPEYSLKLLSVNESIDINNIIEEIGYKNYEQIMLKGYNYYFDDQQEIISFQFYYH